MTSRSRISLALFACVPVAQAAPQQLFVSPGARYQQTADTIVSALGFNTQVELRLDAQADATAGTLRRADGASESAFAASNRLTFFGSYPTASEYASANAAGTYAIDVTAGSLAGSTGAYAYPANLLPNGVPSLTGDSYSRLQNARADLPITLTNSVFTNSSFASVTSVSINDPATGISHNLVARYGQPFDAFTIPAGFLQRDHDYNLSLVFFNEASGSLTGFGADLPVSFGAAASVRVPFRTNPVPEPATLVALSLASLVPLRRRRH